MPPTPAAPPPVTEPAAPTDTMLSVAFTCTDWSALGVTVWFTWACWPMAASVPEAITFTDTVPATPATPPPAPLTVMVLTFSREVASTSVAPAALVMV